MRLVAHDGQNTREGGCSPRTHVCSGGHVKKSVNDLRIDPSSKFAIKGVNGIVFIKIMF